MRRVNWTITEQQHRELKRLSNETGLPISELVRRALDEYFRTMRSSHNASADNDSREQEASAGTQSEEQESEVLK